MNKPYLIIVILLAFVSCKQPEARRPVSVSSGSFINASVERNKKLYAHEQSLIEKIIKKDKENNYIASESGFWYYYNTKVEIDSLETPKFGDIVNYDYNVKALNGSVIYSKEELKTQNYAMDREELFTGLREGLKLLKTGETATFLFPSQKAYGYYGDEHKIGSNKPIICEVTINSITQNQTN
ncbi:FKBP-type peptidyl-prolyl cis-trans isomerase [Mariniflexile rhizosphaerae]|uniref:gliding motility-associated peptidyl-prolyl isomerase GldI n=1 Tax=unclassified Mariniflexile TaxID=2643887 RepID=UPI000CB616E5|nr:gliding motility-associated peptidyl-prolyl isomerase GldI [Mariniflexile sp. TRM1-10]AXP81411.1 FKBP-type peptidyl-prolyl cis-trans isomerase [Mariniflexile sp. TRM1-10]PLB18488.1 MAG: Gliding motility lipoprotein GldI [Flavobacteriaceae bacterium FS1-H7996/R]